MKPVHAAGVPRPLCPLRACAVWICILVLIVPSFYPATMLAQSARIVPQAGTTAAGAAEEDAAAVELMVGRSTVLNVPAPISRVSLTSPDVADVLVTTSQQVLIHGKTTGTISMFVWERGGGIRRYEVRVGRDLEQLEHQLRTLFPGEPISVSNNGRQVLLSGTVTNKIIIEKAGDVAAGYVAKKEDVVNLLQQPQGLGSNQVMLKVRFAEVGRTALTEVGASFFTGPEGYKDYIGRTTTQQFPAPEFDDGKLVFSDFLNFFLFNTKHNVGTLIRALQNRGLFQSLAEPNLIAQNGKEASFLAGGEYPYPVVQGGGNGLAVTISFKEFGIKLNFTPTVLGNDLIHLKVRPEVSTLDFANAVTVEGFRVPALSTRRTETELELRDGQTFAIAGLLNNSLTSSMQKIPGIGDIPILGLLFKSKASRREQTELVVMITPQIVKPGSPGAADGLPGLSEQFMPPVGKPIPQPPPYGPRTSMAPPSAPPAASTAAPAGATQPTRATFPDPPANSVSTKTGQPVRSAPAPANTTTAPVVAPSPAAVVAPAPKPLSKQERQAIEQERKEEKLRLERETRAREEARKQAAEDAKVQQRVAREQAKRDAEDARKAEEVRKRQEEEDRKRGKALAEAEARLKAAQAAYQKEVKDAGAPGSQP
jgi:pilus assembly protein CpaC